MLKIRNFSIIAHIDHGKSTVSDRIIQLCGGLQDREMTEQVLDSMDIEKERGITIKSQTVRLKYKSKDGNEYIFNLMDTPGHVDFGYEVSRCLSACEGCVLLVDATQGVEAQTLANAYKAVDVGIEILPALNKIDLPSSQIDNCKKQIEEVVGLDTSNIALVSGKTGDGVLDMLEQIIHDIPAPSGNVNNPLKALLVDAWYDTYLGVILLVRVIDGELKKGAKIKTLSNGNEYTIEQLGFFTPKKVPCESIKAGEVGYLCANFKNVQDCNIGDTIVSSNDEQTQPLEGFKKVQPVVFCGVYPIDTEDYPKLKESLAKLSLNDSSINYEYETSASLGMGFRCGFLGLLHMEVIHERLEREFDLNIITTAPSVVYKVHLQNGNIVDVHNPSDMPDPTHIKYIEEPIAEVSILTTEEHIGALIKLCEDRRGKQKNLSFSGGNRAVIIYDIPLGEIIFDFHDKLKSVSRGYASFEWQISRYEESEIVKIDILLNGEKMDALSLMAHRSRAEQRGRALCEKLKDLIPRQMFVIPIQAAIGGKIIARETISAYRKDVLAKCYGGDITRKRKLLEKQKKGKKRMKMCGNVEVPQSAFTAVLKMEEK
ncbi:MAG: translation elongation factor 4 [Rickettsiales bacterium]|nr:translation elongation factor 4 [Rickettsiales bacterium]